MTAAARLALLLFCCLSVSLVTAEFECHQEDDAAFRECLKGRVQSSAKPVLVGVDSVHLVSLQRRQDRRDLFFRNTSFPPESINVFPAVDKLELRLTGPIRRLFEHSDYNYRRGIVACALSHFSLWLHIASTENQLHMVLEDDAMLAADFIRLWNQKYAYALPLDVQLLYMGGLLAINAGVYSVGTVLQPVNRAFMRHLPTQFFSHDFIDGVDRGVRGGPSRRYLYTTLSYVISSQAARAMVDMLVTHGFRRGADHTLYRLMDVFEEVYATHPLLAAQASPTETDIQTDMQPVRGLDTPTFVSTTGTVANTIGPLADVPTFVINLDRSPDRLEHFSLQAARARINVTRFSAVDGSLLDMEGLRKRNILGPRYPWNWRGSAACALTHFILYEQMLQSNATHYLIFEDDAYLSADFLPKLADALALVPEDWDVLNVGCFGWSCDGTMLRGNIMAPNTKCVSGTSSYIITRRGARTMLDVCLPMNENIDKQSRDHYGTRLKFYCTKPTLSEQNWDLRPDRIERDRVPS